MTTGMTIIEFRGQKIAMMHFPYRKKVCLGMYDEHNNIWHKVATFNNDDAADDFMEYLARFVGAKTDG